MGSGFNQLAPIYDSMARLVFGQSIRKVQLHFLPEIKKGKRILILGGGTGWLLEEVLRQARPTEVVYIDLSAKMIGISRERVRKMGSEQLHKVVFFEGELRDWEDSKPFDVVITHFYLDLFPEKELKRVMERIGQLIEPGTGTWLFADFSYPRSGLIKIWAKFLIPFMYGFFRLFAGIPGKKLPDFSVEFHRVGMKESQSAMYYGGMMIAKSYKPEF